MLLPVVDGKEGLMTRHEQKCFLRDVLTRVVSQRRPDFSGVGILLCNGGGGVPMAPLLRDTPRELPLSGVDRIAGLLASYASYDCRFHDGFAVIDGNGVLTAVSQYFSPPIVPGLRTHGDNLYGGRFRAAQFGSCLPGVVAAGVLSSHYGPLLLVDGDIETVPSVGPTHEPLSFAVLGDIHGRFQEAARLIEETEQTLGQGLTFVLQVGDIEAHRNATDLDSMYAPHREKRLGDFPAYHSGVKEFPRPMFCIGGNHESYLFLEQWAEGGELARNITYLGRSGTSTIDGLTVSFLSGVYCPELYLDARSRPGPTDGDDFAAQRALATYRAAEVNSLKYAPRPHILLTHEWPLGVVRPEDHEQGTPHHRHLRYNETGESQVRQLADSLAPTLLCCGHVHRRYRGEICHHGRDSTAVHCLGLPQRGFEGIAVFTFDGMTIKEVDL